MRFAALTMVLTAAAAPAQPVAVCAPYIPDAPMLEGCEIASAIFQRAGVKLHWMSSARCPSDALRISLSGHTPDARLPGAFGFARPFERSKIGVFLDRLGDGSSNPMRGRLLGHVLAHEITHMLEFCAYHSATGLRKAHWEHSDFRAMRRGLLGFTDDDLVLIRRGLEHRRKIMAFAGQMKQDVMMPEAHR